MYVTPVSLKQTLGFDHTSCPRKQSYGTRRVRLGSTMRFLAFFAALILGNSAVSAELTGSVTSDSSSLPLEDIEVSLYTAVSSEPQLVAFTSTTSAGTYATSPT